MFRLVVLEVRIIRICLLQRHSMMMEQKVKVLQVGCFKYELDNVEWELSLLT